jgi:signal transduction histidine kinase
MHRMMNLQNIPLWYYTASALLNFITCFSLALFIFLKNPRSSLSQTFSGFCFFIAQWSFFSFFWLVTGDLQLADFFMRTCMIGVIIMPVTFTHFVSILVDKKDNKVLVIVNYLIAILLAASVYSPLFAKQGGSFRVFPYWLLPGKIFPLHLVHFLANLVYSYFLIFKALKYSEGLLRAQVRYVILGTVIGFIGGWTNYLYWYRIPLIPPFLNITASFGVPFIAYAIKRYRLMDIRVALTRAGIFTVVYALVLAIPFGVAIGGRFWLMDIIGQYWFLAPMVLLLIFATAGPFAYLYIQKKAEDRILKKQRKTQHAFAERFEYITLVRQLDKLLNVMVRAITKVLKVNYAAIFLLDRRSTQYKLSISSLGGRILTTKSAVVDIDSPLINYIHGHRAPLIYEELKLKPQNTNSADTSKVTSSMSNISAQVIVPSFIKDTLLGFVVLGNKVSGEIYNEGDLLILTRMSNYSALAIEYAQFLKEYDETQAKLREAEKLKGIGQLMYSLNHEILNAFNLILPPVEMLLMGIYKDNQQKIEEFLRNIQTGVNRCMRVLNDIKSFRYKSASDIIRPRNIQELTHSALGGLSEEIKQENIQLDVVIEPNLPLIQAKDTMEDLPHNIISNCVYALEDKPREKRFLYINVCLSEDKKNIIFKTQDTGTDITKDADTHDTGSPFKERARMGGVNLGLANLIVSAHNGTLTLNSYEKGGTTFIITLPIAQETL